MEPKSISCIHIHLIAGNGKGSAIGQLYCRTVGFAAFALDCVIGHNKVGFGSLQVNSARVVVTYILIKGDFSALAL